MGAYEKPVCRELGRMEAVTLKTGPNNDGGGENRTPGDPPPDWFCDLFPFLRICGGAGIGGGGLSGTGSF